MTSAPPATLPSERPEATLSTIGLFVFVVLAWSLNWVVMKLALQDITPL